MKKFTQVEESKKFLSDPTLLKRYASFIIPLYLNGELKCDKNLIDEYLEMNKKSQSLKNSNVISDLEILAIKNIFSNPLTEDGFKQLKNDINNNSYKLEVFLRRFIRRNKEFQ